jgi:hypothetical protein
MNEELAGIEKIRSFVNSVGAPPDFVMQASGFRRNGDEAIQTGDWRVASSQRGSFSVTWRRDSSNDWKIVTWVFDGG